MDSNQFIGQGLSYSSSSIPSKLLASLKFNSRPSPNSPFSDNLDSDTQTSSISDSHSPSCNSSLDYISSTFLYSNHGGNIKHALQELETELMGPPDEQDEQKAVSSSNRSSSSSLGGEEFRAEKRHKMKAEWPAGNLKELLALCASALSEERFSDFDRLIEEARGVVSITGEPIQRLGAYVVEGLVARKESSGTNIYQALRCKEPRGKDLLSYMHILYEICPYLKFGYMAANGAIAEAVRDEDRIHIIDFQIAQGTQWVTLLQALAARPSGPPQVRITGIDDPVSKYARGGSLEAVGKRLAAISERFNIPVEFIPVPVFPTELTRDMLDVRQGEAVAVNFPLQLHHTPDESVDVGNPRDGLLRLVKSLSPKVTTLVEQESNTNTTPFLTRFQETVDYYLAVFESIDVALPRDWKERINVEQHCLARDIVNIIACEGPARVERHEVFGKWKARLTMAGFKQGGLSSYVNSVIRGLLKSYSDDYTLVEKDGAMLLGWKGKDLISASAWN